MADQLPTILDRAEIATSWHLSHAVPVRCRQRVRARHAQRRDRSPRRLQPESTQTGCSRTAEPRPRARLREYSGSSSFTAR
jgi:hypothetical protein